MQEASIRKVTALLVLVAGMSALAGCVSLGSTSADVLPAGSAAQGELREFDLYVVAGTFSPVEGKVVPALLFSTTPEGPGSVPGPELRVREGDTVRVRFHDQGGLHTIHWHGLKVPWSMDGVPFVTQDLSEGGPGVFTYEWVALESGTYWYHCHFDVPVHIDAGMLGPLIVEPRDPAHDPPFDREATLMLHEVDSTRSVLTPGALTAAARAGDAARVADILAATPDRAGNLPANPVDKAEAVEGGARGAYEVALAIAAPAEAAETLGGMEGPRDYYPERSPRYRPRYDTFMINGKSFPETEPVFLRTGETLRVRLINAGQLVHTMHVHGTHALVTHKDGYKLQAPYHADSILIGPGERYDLYIEGDNPGMWDFHDHGGAWDVGSYNANDHAFPGGMGTMLIYEDFAHAQLPAPEPERGWQSRDFVARAPSFHGVHGMH